jgi:hypothetical protein
MHPVPVSERDCFVAGAPRNDSISSDTVIANEASPYIYSSKKELHQRSEAISFGLDFEIASSSLALLLAMTVSLSSLVGDIDTVVREHFAMTALVMKPESCIPHPLTALYYI